MFDTERLIGEVEGRPCLWRKADPAYADRDGKADAWGEVARALFPDWDDFPAEDKVEKGNDIRRRWRSLKDSFAREVKIKQREKKSGLQKKRKTYIFYDLLIFLKHNLTDGKRTSIKTEACADESSTDNQSAEEGPTTEDNLATPLILPTLLAKRPNEPSTSLESLRKSTFGSHFPMTTTAGKISRKRTAGHPTDDPPDKKDRRSRPDIDEDKAFFLSLLPAVRKFNDQQKMDLRIEILNAMKRIQYHPGFVYPPYPPPQYGGYPPPYPPQGYPYYAYPSPSSSMTVPVHPFNPCDPVVEAQQSMRSDSSDSVMSEASDVLHFREV